MNTPETHKGLQGNCHQRWQPGRCMYHTKEAELGAAATSVAAPQPKCTVHLGTAFFSTLSLQALGTVLTCPRGRTHLVNGRQKGGGLATQKSRSSDRKSTMLRG